MSAYENEPVTLSRDVEAVIVPAGTAITLKAGLSGFITQALGGSFTLYIEGNLYRIPGAQADAIGKEVVPAPELPPGATDEDVRNLAWSQMRRCYDPEIPVNIVDLGLVYDCNLTKNRRWHSPCGGQHDAHRARLRHGRGAGARRAREAGSHPHREPCGRAAGV